MTEIANILLVDDADKQAVSLLEENCSCHFYQRNDLADIIALLKKRWFNLVILNISTNNLADMLHINREIISLIAQEQIENVDIIALVDDSYIEEESTGLLSKIFKNKSSLRQLCLGSNVKYVIKKPLDETFLTTAPVTQLVAKYPFKKGNAIAMDKYENEGFVSPEVKAAMEVLDICSADSMADIKSKYNNLVKKYHPDTTEYDVAIASEMIAKISNSYKIIVNYRSE